MELTLFDLIILIKDTEKPIIILIGDLFRKYCYAEIATDNELLALNVAGFRCDTFDGRPSYIVKIRG